MSGERLRPLFRDPRLPSIPLLLLMLRRFLQRMLLLLLLMLAVMVDYSKLHLVREWQGAELNGLGRFGLLQWHPLVFDSEMNCCLIMGC